jgi:hypothetical protein
VRKIWRKQTAISFRSEECHQRRGKGTPIPCFLA